jgi:putative hydrolase of HD superfamily
MSGNSERLKKQFDFCLEADKEKQIKRRTLLSNGKTAENDAEHAWHAALMCVLLSEYANEKIDVLRTVTMLLIHDIVEIDAGDTYAYDDSAKLSQRERELKAADRIFALLPKDQAQKLRALCDEFEAEQTPESKFAHTMDNIQPAMLNNSTNGKVWAENKISLSQILERNKITPEGSETLWEYSLNNFIMPNVEDKKIIKDQ